MHALHTMENSHLWLWADFDCVTHYHKIAGNTCLGCQGYGWPWQGYGALPLCHYNLSKYITILLVAVLHSMEGIMARAVFWLILGTCIGTSISLGPISGTVEGLTSIVDCEVSICASHLNGCLHNTLHPSIFAIHHFPPGPKCSRDHKYPPITFDCISPCSYLFPKIVSAYEETAEPDAGVLETNK